METKEMIKNTESNQLMEKTLNERYVPDTALIDANMISDIRYSEGDAELMAGFVY